MPVITNPPLKHSTVSLDISGVAGFFGGDVAVGAMATATLYRGRKWLGWYNSPGSYEIAKRYGQLAQSSLWCGLYPGTKEEPAVLFELDGKIGPKYCAVQSGTFMAKTGHLAYLLLKECSERPLSVWQPPATARTTSPVDVTIAALHHTPEVTSRPRDNTLRWTNSFSFIPIAASVATTVACALVGDWICLAAIALGMLGSGLSCFVIGSGEFTFTHPKPATGAPPGDGILEEGDQIIILQGDEGAINPITRGKFSLEYTSGPSYHDIGMASMVLTAQFLAQLLMVPQGTIFGQIMFLSSLAVSWVYNSYLSSLDKESIQRRILVDSILQVPRFSKFRLGTRTTVVVFVLLVLARSETSVSEDSLKKIMNHLLPNETDVWSAFKAMVLSEVQDKGRTPSFELDESRISHLKCDKAKMDLVKTLITDALTAYSAFQAYSKEQPSRTNHITDLTAQAELRVDEDAEEKFEPEELVVDEKGGIASEEATINEAASIAPSTLL